MAEILETFLLGVIQGATEFLPVSSSGHLIIAQTFMGTDTAREAGTSAMFLEMMLHVATGLAVVAVFWKDIIGLIKECVSPDVSVRNAGFRYSGYIVLATIPAALVGVFLGDFIERLYDVSDGKTAAYLAALMLFVTAALLFYSSIKKCCAAKDAETNNTERRFSMGNLTLMTAAFIGLAQAIAIMPGISRSGSTIAVALILGVSREEAGRFSFMLALPAIFGGALLDARKVETWGSALTIDVIIGFVAAFAVGFAALKLLLTFVKKGKLYYFGYYCATAAIVSILCLTFL